MRTILRDTCILAALMILTVFTFSIAGAGFTEEIRLVFRLFALALILSVINYVFDEITSLPILAGYLVKYLVVTGIVIAFGFIVGWFFPSNFWMAFIYVGVIAVIIYALDSVKTEKDIEEINEMVKRSKNEKVEYIPLKKRKGWKILLVLLIVMIVLCASSLAGLICFADYDSRMRSSNKYAAEQAGYNKVYISCTKEDNAVIDGKVYECYQSYQYSFAGNISSEEIYLYFEYGTSYIDGTEGEKTDLRIYCNDAGDGTGADRFIEPYSIYNAGKLKYENYCMEGFAVSGLAVIILLTVLVVYLAVSIIRKKTFEK